MASSGRENFDVIAGEIVGRGRARLARNLGIGLQLIAASADKTNAYYAAADQLQYAAAREQRALKSLVAISTESAAKVAPLLAALDHSIRDDSSELSAAHGRAPIPARTLSSAERELASLRPVGVGTPADFYARRDRIAEGETLNGYLAQEILNAIDGARTGLDLYRRSNPNSIGWRRWPDETTDVDVPRRVYGGCRAWPRSALRAECAQLARLRLAGDRAGAVRWTRR